MDSSNKKNIHILITVDEGFYNYLLVCLNSILDNTLNPITLYLTNRLSTSKVNYLRTLDSQLTVVVLDDEIVSKSNSVYKGTKRWSSTVCDRLFAPFYVSGIDRLVYLDVDIVVICDIATLYDVNLKGKTIGASGYPYFNSGVIVYDINKLNEKYGYMNMVSGIKLDKNDYPDQDYLNEVFKNDFHDIGFCYNYRAHNTFLWKNPKKHGGVIHYLGKIKPDSYKWIEYKANKLFWKYAIKIYGRKYRMLTAIRSLLWYPIAVYKRFRFHTGRE